MLRVLGPIQDLPALFLPPIGLERLDQERAPRVKDGLPGRSSGMGSLGRGLPKSVLSETDRPESPTVSRVTTDIIRGTHFSAGGRGDESYARCPPQSSCSRARSSPPLRCRPSISIRTTGGWSSDCRLGASDCSVGLSRCTGRVGATSQSLSVVLGPLARGRPRCTRRPAGHTGNPRRTRRTAPGPDARRHSPAPHAGASAPAAPPPSSPTRSSASSASTS
jgi:hypothetical protein